MQALYFLLMMLGIAAITNRATVTQYQTWSNRGNIIAGEMLDASAKLMAWCDAGNMATCQQSGGYELPGTSMMPSATSTKSYYSNAYGTINAVTVQVGTQWYVISTFASTPAATLEATNYMYGLATAALVNQSANPLFTGYFSNLGSGTGTFIPGSGPTGNNVISMPPISGIPVKVGPNMDITLSNLSPMTMMPLE